MDIDLMSKKNQLLGLIRSVGNLYDEDPKFLEEYAREQVAAWSDTPERLEQAIKCFQTEKEKALRMVDDEKV